MSAAKTYYWLKLNENFFEEDTIAFIEEQENGIIYSNFYLKLCLKAIRTEGRLMRVVGNTLLPYDVKSLAKLTGVPADTVAVAMNLFEKIGLVTRLETGEIYLAQLNELTGKETDKAQLMRRKRAEEKLKSGGNIVTPALPLVDEPLPECYTEYRDKSIEIRDQKEREKEGPDAAHPAHSIPYEQIREMYNQTCKSFPRCTVMSDARKKAVKARIAGGYTVEDFKRLFEKAEASSFLKGQNNRNWMATLDWMLKDANMAKVLDGNYDDHREDSLPAKTSDLDDLF